MTEYSLDKEIKKLEEDKKRGCNILGMYFADRRPDLRSKAQYDVAFKRHIKAANLLVPFDNDQILNAVKQAKDFCPTWTLDTIIKILTK